jgi:hypothetical protein
MVYYNLLVKGNQEEAREAATRRLSARAIVSVRETDKVRNTTIVKVFVEKDSLDVHRWFGEPAKCYAGIGYWHGTLLFFYEE